MKTSPPLEVVSLKSSTPYNGFVGGGGFGIGSGSGKKVDEFSNIYSKSPAVGFGDGATSETSSAVNLKLSRSSSLSTQTDAHSLALQKVSIGL